MRANRLGVSMVAFGAYTAAMLVLERRMRETGGPGIIPFELAGNASRAETIMARWGSDGQRAPAELPGAVLVAVAGDALEGVWLLKVLDLVGKPSRCAIIHTAGNTGQACVSRRAGLTSGRSW